VKHRFEPVLARCFEPQMNTMDADLRYNVCACDIFLFPFKWIWIVRLRSYLRSFASICGSISRQHKGASLFILSGSEVAAIKVQSIRPTLFRGLHRRREVCAALFFFPEEKSPTRIHVESWVPKKRSILKLPLDPILSYHIPATR